MDDDLAPLKMSVDTSMPLPKPPATPVLSTPIPAKSISTSTSTTTTESQYDNTTLPRYGINPEVDRIRAQAELTKANLDTKLVDSQIAIAQENWIKAYWRPACGWLYIFICFMDFFGFPLLVMIMPQIYHAHGIKSEYLPWVPLTLQGAGTFHLAFLAILGVAAWTRGTTQRAMIEK